MGTGGEGGGGRTWSFNNLNLFVFVANNYLDIHELYYSCIEKEKIEEFDI